MRRSSLLIALFPLALSALECPQQDVPVSKEFQRLGASVLDSSDTVFPTLLQAVQAQSTLKAPAKFIPTSLTDVPRFPSFSRCEKSFFRVATINKTVDDIISRSGWLSGWARRSQELEKMGAASDKSNYDALPPSVSFEDRIVEYVRVKDVPSQFPKNSSVVGVLEDPIRTLSVGYHTGANGASSDAHMRMDEIEVGPCARAPECQRIQAVDSSRVFQEKGLTPRYSTEGEWAIEMEIPPSCVVATYRITYQKVDQVCYSDTNDNCNF